jgi:hypothetical protein
MTKRYAVNSDSAAYMLNLLRHCGDRRQNRSSEQQSDYYSGVERRTEVIPAPRLGKYS